MFINHANIPFEVLQDPEPDTKQMNTWIKGQMEEKKDGWVFSPPLKPAGILQQKPTI